ncbi:MAG: chorismate synthase [Bdellovibrionota bacterium]
MSANSFGKRFRITTFGESHGPALGVVVEGCPSGLELDLKLLQRNLDRRRPNQSAITTSRNETDAYEILSGVYEGKTLGTPLTLIVRNNDQKSQDYNDIKAAPRAGHSDDVWKEKFGHTDHRGGGRSSGRETVTRVLAGSIAQMLCHKLAPELEVLAFSYQIASHTLSEAELKSVSFDKIESSSTRFPGAASSAIEDLLKKSKAEGESHGGIIRTVIKGVPAGIGQPVFHKLKSDLTAALMSIGATTGVALGNGVEQIELPGTQFHRNSQDVYGGVRGGISTGEQMQIDTYFKPTSSILDVAKKGRHDPCILPRAVPVVESMVYLVLADHMLWARTDKLE